MRPPRATILWLLATVSSSVSERHLYESSAGLLLLSSPPFNATIRVDNKIYITCEKHSDCVRLNGHARVECDSHTTSNKTTIKLCRCFDSAGLTPPGDCVEANCTFGPRSCMNTNINAPLGLAAYILDLTVAGMPPTFPPLSVFPSCRKGAHSAEPPTFIGSVSN